MKQLKFIFLLSCNLTLSQIQTPQASPAAKFEQTDFKIFGKPSARPFRRMGVALSYGSRSVEELVKSAKEVASCIKIY